jgi:hypothetical protein
MFFPAMEYVVDDESEKCFRNNAGTQRAVAVDCWSTAGVRNRTQKSRIEGDAFNVQSGRGGHSYGHSQTFSQGHCWVEPVPVVRVDDAGGKLRTDPSVTRRRSFRLPESVGQRREDETVARFRSIAQDLYDVAFRPQPID